MLLDKEFYGDIRVENEVHALSKSGFNVYVFCFSFSDTVVKESNFHGAKIINLSVPQKIIRKLRALTNTIFNIYPYFLAWLLKREIINYKIDILHIHDLYLFQAGLKLRKKLPNLKLVGDLHENYVEGLKHYKFSNSFPGSLLISISRWTKKEIEWCKQYDYLITVIEEAVDRYETLGLDRRKFTVVANYVNEESFLKDDFDINILEELKNDFYITYIGGFDTHRGLESTIKAMPLIIKEEPSAKLLLVGGGRIENSLKNLAKELNVVENVKFAGYQPVEKLPSFIKGSDICLIPHLKTMHTDNTIPHKLFHYMLLGKPVVTSDCNPLKRIVNEANCGLVYVSNNELSLAKTIIRLMQEKESLGEYGNRGKSAVKDKYNWERTSLNLIDLYKGINE